MLRKGAGLDPDHIGVGFEPGDEEYPLTCPAGEEIVIGIAPIQHDDASSWKIEPLGHFDIGGLAVGYMAKNGQIAFMIQQQMQFEGALALPPMGPIKHAGT